MKEILTLRGNYQKWKFIEVLLPFHVKNSLYNDVNIPPVKYPSINGRLCCWATFWRLLQIIEGSCLAPDWLSIHLEVVQKHSCAGSICNFLFVASQTHYCASYPNHNHMGPSAVVEFSHWRKHTNSAGAATFSVTTWASRLLWWLPWIRPFHSTCHRLWGQIMDSCCPNLPWGGGYLGILLFFVVVVVVSKEKHLFGFSFGSFISDQIESVACNYKKKKDKYGVISV